MDIPVSYTNFNPFTYVNNGCTYILYNLSDIGTTAGSIQFTIPAGTIYMAIQGFPGSAGEVGSNGGGGGGGGSGGFFNGQINNTTTGTMLYFTIAYPSISLTNSNNTSNYFSIPYGISGDDSSGTDGGNGGKGGSWSDQLSSSNIQFSTFTANGGGGGGGGNSTSGSDNGNGGVGGNNAGYTGNTTEPTSDTIGYYTFLDDAYGLNGQTGGYNLTSSGAGSTLYNFLDGSNILESAGQGGGNHQVNSSGSITENATNGSLPYIMLYYQTADTIIDDPTTIAYSSNYTFLYPTTTTTSPVNLSVSQYTITGTTIAQTQTAVNCISNTSYNPLTYAVPDNWTYSMIYCPTCTSTTDTTTDTTTTTYYEATWTVPSSGTYYWAGIGPGGTANNQNYYSKGSSGSMFGGSGGSGNGCFVTGQLINGQTYTFQMYDTTVTTNMPVDNSTYTHNAVSSTTYNTLINGTNNSMYMYGGGIGGCGAESTAADGLTNDYGVNGGPGGPAITFSSNASITNFFNSTVWTTSGSGGGGGAAEGATSQVIGEGGTVVTSGFTFYGETGYDGFEDNYLDNASGNVNTNETTNAGQGGNMYISFYDGSSSYGQAGNGAIMLNNDESSNAGETYLTINATSGTPTWMMIYY